MRCRGRFFSCVLSSFFVLALAPQTPGQDAISVVPAADGRPALAVPAGVAAADLALPDWLTVGSRISWHGGDSVLAGVSSKLVPAAGPGGQWVDPTTGRKYNDEAVRSTGGVGYHQANIIAARARFIAVDARNYPITDVQRNIASSGGVLPVVGNAVSVGVYWVHPQLLARISSAGAPPQPAGVTLVRGPYTLRGRPFQAVTITAEYATGYSRTVYDLESGILLFRSSSNVDGSVPTVGPQGQVTSGRGNAMISHLMFLGMRRLEIPWRDDPIPEWATTKRRLDFHGSTTAVTSMGRLPGQGVSCTVQLGKWVDGVASGRIVNVVDVGSGLPPQQSTEERFYASGMFQPLWISAASLAKLRPGQVLDQDPVTNFRTVFEGTQGTVASILVQGSTESNQFFYDRQTGLLSGMRTVRQNPVGQIYTELMAVR